MEWYNILAIVLGSVGGVGGITAGFISIYNARSNKDTIDIGNMKQMLDEAHNMYDEMKGEKDSVRQEFTDYKEETQKYITEFKGRFSKLERRLDRAETLGLHLRGAIYQAYRCPFPDNVQNCPVIKEYDRSNCEECLSQNEEIDE